MKFIRIFWGEFERYEHQIIEAKKDNLNEVVFVWGKTNYDKIKKLGYDCILINSEPYDYTIASNHLFLDYRCMIHKIVGIRCALENFDEVIFLDWDCRKVKELDDMFYKLIKYKKSQLQASLYPYPKQSLDFLETEVDSTVKLFISKLKEYVPTYSFEFGESYVLPNAGFIYCSNIKIIDKLLDLIKEYALETLSDEFCMFLFTKEFGLDNYIREFEPIVVGKKQHGYDWWDMEEDKLMNYKQSLIKKQIYFEHF